jgi:hypothetical protein
MYKIKLNLTIKTIILKLKKKENYFMIKIVRIKMYFKKKKKNYLKEIHYKTNFYFFQRFFIV